MTPGATDAVPWFDRLLARWEVSRFTVVPFGTTFFATPFTVASLFLTLLEDRRAVILALMIVVLWTLPVAFGQGRGWCLFRHPHASPRWLRCVRCVVGETVFDEALSRLAALYGHDPDYCIERAHMADAVRVVRNARRQDRQRSEGVRPDAAAR